MRTLIVTVAAMCLFSMAGTVQANLLSNPGFEEDTPPALTGWGTTGGGTIGASSDDAHSGSHSLRIDSTGAGAWASPNVSQSLPASPGEMWNLGGYMFTSTGVTGDSFGLLKIVFRDGAGNDLTPVSADIGILNTGQYPGIHSQPFLNRGFPVGTWVFTEAQGTAPAGTQDVVLFALNVNAPADPQAMYFDDLSARRLAGSTVGLMNHFQVDYLLDDCTPDSTIGRGGRGDMWVANALTAQDGGEMIVSIEASFGDTRSWPLGVHLYDDPNDDGVPNDLVLLQSIQRTFPQRGAGHEFPIPPTEVSGVFFVALSYADTVGSTAYPYDFPFLLDTTSNRAKTWYVETSSPGSLDPAHLPSPILSQSSIPGYRGQYFIRATGVPGPFPIVGMTYRKEDVECDLAWGATTGAFYEILRSSDLGLGEWEVLDSGRIPAHGTQCQYSLPLQTDAACYAVRRTQPPALLEEDFETGAPGWVVTTAQGTPWELGTPQNGPFSARSGTAAFGTNLDGNYASSTRTVLTSPPIVLPDEPAAGLSFWYIVDTPLSPVSDQDRLVVEIVSDPSVALFTGHRVTEIPSMSTWFWKYTQQSVPQSLMNSTRYLRFIFEDDGNGYATRGAYVDDVCIR